MAPQQVWQSETWNWDPYKLVAAAAGEAPVEAANKSQDGTVEMSSSGSDGAAEGSSGKRGSRDGPVICQVEGCQTDLAGLKEYHNRYKICQYHLKIPCIIREGNSQRFCQQCGRFHNVGEFDGDKRSCRARLQRHNARRRKKGETELVKAAKKTAKSDKTAQSQQVSQDASEDMQVESSTAEFSQGLPSLQHLHQDGVPQSVTESKMGRDWQDLNSSSTDTAMDNVFSDFLSQENLYNFQHSAPMQDFSPSHVSGGNSAMSNEDIFGQPQAGTSGLYTAAMDVQQDGLVPDMMLSGPHAASQGLMNPEFFPPTSFTQGAMSPMYLMQQQALQTARQQGYLEGIRTQQAQHQMMLQRQQQVQQQQQQMQLQPQQHDQAWPQAADHKSMTAGFDVGMGMKMHMDPAQPQDRQGLPQLHSAGSFSGQAQPAASVTQSQSSSVLSEARDILSFNHSQPEYIPDEQFTRMSAKLFNCTPAHLPPDLKQNLVGLLSCGVNSIEGYIRPGCVQLTLNALLSQERHEAMQSMGVREAFDILLQDGDNKAFWGSDTMLMQWQDDLAVVKQGKIEQVLSGIGSVGLLPQMHSVYPVCVSNSRSTTLFVSGTNITKRGCSVLCRHQGEYVPVTVTHEPASSFGTNQLIKVHLPSGLRRGALQLEMLYGGFTSASQAVLVMDSEEAVAELSQLHNLPVLGLHVNSMMLDVGRVLEYSNNKQAHMMGCTKPCRVYAAADVATIAATARRLLSFTCQMGWTAVSEMLLVVAQVTGQDIDWLIEELDEISDKGCTFLHHAVRSRSAALVGMVCTWGVNNGFVWDFAAAGPKGLTPLHFAALLGDGGRVAHQLAEACPGAMSGWFSVKADDGSTAADFASLAGAQDINTSMASKLDGEAPETEEYGYSFNPETGELVEDQELDVPTMVMDTVPPASSEQQNQLQSAGPIFHVPQGLQADRPHLMKDHIPDFLSTAARDFEVLPEKSRSSEQVAGLRHSKKLSRMSYKSDDDVMYLGNKGLTLKPPPHVFDRQAAAFSFGVIGIVGCFALGLRSCLDYKGLEYWAN